MSIIFVRVRCVVNALILEFLTSRTSKGRSPKYVKDLRNRLRRFQDAFGEQNADARDRPMDFRLGFGDAKPVQLPYDLVQFLFVCAFTRLRAKLHGHGD